MTDQYIGSLCSTEHLCHNIKIIYVSRSFYKKPTKIASLLIEAIAYSLRRIFYLRKAAVKYRVVFPE